MAIRDVGSQWLGAKLMHSKGHIEQLTSWPYLIATEPSGKLGQLLIPTFNILFLFLSTDIPYVIN